MLQSLHISGITIIAHFADFSADNDVKHVLDHRICQKKVSKVLGVVNHIIHEGGGGGVTILCLQWARPFCAKSLLDIEQMLNRLWHDVPHDIEVISKIFYLFKLNIILKRKSLIGERIPI